jgi:indolepyruvate ferredoxin oxidoreductase alpha subunit
MGIGYISSHIDDREIMQLCSSDTRVDNLRTEMSINAKVAMESAIGASLAGVNSVNILSYNGLAFSADPFLALTGTKLNGSLTFVLMDYPAEDSFNGKKLALAADFPTIILDNSENFYLYLSYMSKLSIKYKIPVVLVIPDKISINECLAYEDVSLPDKLPTKGFNKEVTYLPKTVTSTVSLLSENPYIYSLMKDGYINWVDRKEEISKSNLKYGIKVDNSKSNFGLICFGYQSHIARKNYSEVSIIEINMINPLPVASIKEFINSNDYIMVFQEDGEILESLIRTQLPECHDKLIGDEEYDKLIGNEQRQFVSLDSDREYQKIFNYELPSLFDAMKFFICNNFHININPSLIPNLPKEITEYNLSSFHSVGSEAGLLHGIRLAGDSRKIITFTDLRSFLNSGINGFINLVFQNGTGTFVLLDKGSSLYQRFNVKRFAEKLNINYFENNIDDIKSIIIEKTKQNDITIIYCEI